METVAMVGMCWDNIINTTIYRSYLVASVVCVVTMG